MSHDKVEQLYSYYGILADADVNEIRQHEKVYKEILKATTGSDKEKRLACQFIPAFFKHFPDLADMTIDAVFDLCEDNDISLRKLAFKELPVLCRDCPKQTWKVVAILSQLLTVKEPSELKTIQTAIICLFKVDAKAAVKGLCYQVQHGDDAVRNCCLRFMSARMRSLIKDSKIPSIEDIILSEIKQLLKNCAVEEIPLNMKIALSAAEYHSLQGKVKIANMIADCVESFTPFDPKDDDNIERFILLLRHVHLLQMSTTRVRSNRFVLYICEELLPHFKEISNCNEGTGYSLEILQLLAEMARFLDEICARQSAVDSLLSTLMEFIPTPDNDKEIRIHFSYLECLLFTLHRLVKINRSALVKDPEKLNTFRDRLMHLACIVKGHIDSLGPQLDSFFGELPKIQSVGPSNKRRWLQAVQYAEKLKYKDSFLRVNEARQVIKWKTLPPSSHSTASSSRITCATTSVKQSSDFYEKIKSMPVPKIHCLRALAFDTCNNVFLLIKDFFSEPLRFDATIELSFTAQREKVIENTRKGLTENTLSDISNLAVPHESVARLRPSIKPKMALYIPPTGRYSSNIKRVP